METRDCILAVGRSLLLDQGLRAITTNAIAQQARVSKKTLYKLFPNKDALLEAIVVSFIEAHLKRWDAILIRDEPAMDRILASLEFVSGVLPQIQQQLIGQLTTVAPQLWATIDAIRTQRLQKLRSLLVEAQEGEWIRSEIDPDHWILLLTGVIQAVLTPEVLFRTGIPLNCLMASIQTIYFDGLLTDKGRHYLESRET